jgi:hypothetical protein
LAKTTQAGFARTGMAEQGGTDTMTERVQLNTSRLTRMLDLGALDLPINYSSNRITARK